MIDALNELQKEGKIKVFGVSNWVHERIEEANRYAKEHQLQGFSVSSPHFGLAEQIADPWGGNCVTITGKQNKAARNWYQENQMPIIAYSSLARGLMAGRIKSSQEVQAAEILDPFCVKGYVCLIILNVWHAVKSWQRKRLHRVTDCTCMDVPTGFEYICAC